MDKNSIDKQIERLGVEALMSWELPKVENAWNDICQKWFINDCGALVKGTIDVSEDTQNTPAPEPLPEPTTVIVGSYKEKEQCIELGFVQKMVELWRRRRKTLEAKAEISVSGVFQNTLTEQ